MADGWFIADTERYIHPDYPVAYRHAIWLRWMDQILAQGGTFRDEECLGASYIVHVINVTTQLLGQIGNDPGATRFPQDILDADLSGLNNNQKNSVRNKVLALGYSQTEWDATFPGDLGQYTARQVLDFILGRKQEARYNAGTDTIEWNGPQRTPQKVSALE